MSAKTPARNNEVLNILQDLMQMTSDGFARLENRMDQFENRVTTIENQLISVQAKLGEHDLQLYELKKITQDTQRRHTAYAHDMFDILDRVTTLEAQNK